MILQYPHIIDSRYYSKKLSHSLSLSHATDPNISVFGIKDYVILGYVTNIKTCRNIKESTVPMISIRLLLEPFSHIRGIPVISEIQILSIVLETLSNILDSNSYILLDIPIQ